MNNLSRVLILIFSITSILALSACGGGGGGDGKLPDRDSTAPIVLITSPVSGGITTAASTKLTIRFNEFVQTPDKTNVEIFAYRPDGSLDFLNPVSLETAVPFEFDEATNDLTIRPDTTSGLNKNPLIQRTKYHVYVHGIKDREGNSMADCRWEFATSIYDNAVSTSKNLCDTKKPDDKPGRFEFTTVALLNVSEPSDPNATTKVTVVVNRNNGSTGDVSVDYTLVAGSAIAGRNFVDAIGTLNFLDGELQKSIDVDIKRDLRKDQVDQLFSVVLSNAAGGAIIGQNNSYSINIIEIDYSVPLTGTFNFSLPTATQVAEDLAGGVYKIDVIRQLGITGTVVINYTATDIDTNTQGGVDYTIPNTPLTFAETETKKTILITINNDTLIENLEKFSITLSLDTVASAAGAIIGTDNTHTITIKSEDVRNPGVIAFKDPVSSVSEGGGSVSIIVSRVNGLDDPVSVKYKTVAGLGAIGSATNNDYTAITSATLDFANGIGTQTINILITPDFLTEGSEDFTVELFEPLLGAKLGANGAIHKVTITDVVTPGTIQFTALTSTFSEAAGNAVLQLERNGGANGSLVVDYSTANGTALEPGDYTAKLDTVTFLEGEISKPISIQLINDNMVDGDKNFTVNLAAKPGVLGTNVTNTVTINDVGVSRPLSTAELVAIWSLLL